MYKFNDMILSCLAVKSCATPVLRETIKICFSRTSDFQYLQGQIYCMTVLDTFHSSAVLYIDGATTSF